MHVNTVSIRENLIPKYKLRDEIEIYYRTLELGIKDQE
jgi:hypothetical protein